MIDFLKTSLLSLLFIFLSLLVQAQPVDPSQKTYGKPIYYQQLPNGFSYYIKPLENSGNTIHMELLAKVGNYQQDHDQLDIAHALEHMALRSTEHFPKGFQQKIDSSMPNPGIQIGNFLTNHESTQFNLTVNSTNKGAFNNSLLYFKDIIAGLKLLDDEIEAEKGALRQEVIYSEGGNLEDYYIRHQLQEKLFPCRNDYSHFFEHNREFSPKVLQKFYKDWYRPELMTLIVVGNISNIQEIDAKIKAIFSKLSNPKYSRKPRNCDATYFNSPNKFVKLETERENVAMQFFFRDPKTKNELVNFNGIKREVLWECITKVLNKRFKEESEKYFNHYQLLSRYSYTSHPSAFSLKINASPETGNNALKKAFTIKKQLKEYGFTTTEWQDTRREVIEQLSRTDLNGADYWMDQIINQEVYQELLMKNKPEKLKKWLSGLTLKKVNILLQEMIPTLPSDIGIILPKENKTSLYSEKNIRRNIQDISDSKVARYIAPKIPEFLINNKKLSLLTKATYDIMGEGKLYTKILKLENGVKVVLKSFTPSQGLYSDRIMLHGFSPFGGSTFKKEDYFSAINATDIVKNSGVGRLNKFELNRFLKGTSFWQGVQPYIKNNSSGVKGNAELKDFEFLLQLVYLYFSNPRKDTTAFKDWEDRSRKKLIPSYSNSVFTDFKDYINNALGNKNWVPQGKQRLEGLKSTDMEKAYQIYQNIFGNAKNFTFLISGKFDLNEMTDMVCKYLGNLPNNTNSDFHLKDYDSIKDSIMAAPVYQEISIPHKLKSINYFISYLHQTNQYDWQEDIKIKLLGMTVNEQMKSLRYDKNYALYNFGTAGKFRNDIWGYEIGTFIDCIPKQFKSVQKESFKIFIDFREGKVNEALFDDCKKKLLTYYSPAYLNRNPITIQLLDDINQYHKSPVNSKTALNYINSLQVKDIVNTAQLYFQENRRYEFIFKN